MVGCGLLKFWEGKLTSYKNNWNCGEKKPEHTVSVNKLWCAASIFINHLRVCFWQKNCTAYPCTWSCFLSYRPLRKIHSNGILPHYCRIQMVSGLRWRMLWFSVQNISAHANTSGAVCLQLSHTHLNMSFSVSSQTLHPPCILFIFYYKGMPIDTVQVNYISIMH